MKSTTRGSACACRQMLHRRRLGVTARNIEGCFKRNVQACGSMGVHFFSPATVRIAVAVVPNWSVTT
jgi:hypothetical protein